MEQGLAHTHTNVCLRDSPPKKPQGAPKRTCLASVMGSGLSKTWPTGRTARMMALGSSAKNSSATRIDSGSFSSSPVVYFVFVKGFGKIETVCVPTHHQGGPSPPTPLLNPDPKPNPKTKRTRQVHDRVARARGAHHLDVNGGTPVLLPDAPVLPLGPRARRAVAHAPQQLGQLLQLLDAADVGPVGESRVGGAHQRVCP